MEDYQVYSIIPASRQIDGQYKAVDKHFRVEEAPLYEASGQGQHSYLTIEREGLNTDDVVTMLSKAFKISSRSVGYAGKKDKKAVTTQTFSLDLGANFSEDQITHLFSTELSALTLIKSERHTNKIKLGHLRGNYFKIVITTLESDALNKTEQNIAFLIKCGVPNFFGPQRFGQKGDNHICGKEIMLGERKRKGRRATKFLLNALQSYYFNRWLTQRIKDNLFDKVIEGDHINKNQVVTGPLFGAKMIESSSRAFERELQTLSADSLSPEHFQDLLGSRRAISFTPEQLSCQKHPDGIELSFFLPKGCYATSLLDQLVRKD